MQTVHEVLTEQYMTTLLRMDQLLYWKSKMEA